MITICPQRRKNPVFQKSSRYDSYSFHPVRSVSAGMPDYFFHFAKPVSRYSEACLGISGCQGHLACFSVTSSLFVNILFTFLPDRVAACCLYKTVGLSTNPTCPKAGQSSQPPIMHNRLFGKILRLICQCAVNIMVHPVTIF